ncbi:MAG: SagB/ThcOx family dehydrogenase [Thermoanaerobaculia bacterium]
MRRAGGRLVRSPNIAAYWSPRGFVLEEFVRRCRITAAPATIQVLNEFERPATASTVARRFPSLDASSVERQVLRLADLGFLVRGSARRMGDVAERWHGLFPAAFYHFSTREPTYVLDPEMQTQIFAERLKTAPQPSIYKNYGRTARIALPKGMPLDETLSEVLSRRRTSREFGRVEVPLETFAELVRGTWGQTGTVHAGPLGTLLLKTSPSAGARNPVECYVLVRRVRGLRAGLYHYDVRADCLERLRSGEFRHEMIAMASGQRWVGGAAFLCIMTAIADRVYWKYRSSDSYRLFFLDAGHLAQTFVLLATALNLPCFTTAAVQEGRIEEFLGLDGTSEFPIYLCGAGSARTVRPGTLARARSPVHHDR